MPRGPRRRSAAARLLRLWARIPPEARMSVCCECCVLSGRGLCDGLITRPGFYRLWCVVVCDPETSWMRRPWPTGGCRAKDKQAIREMHPRIPWQLVADPSRSAEHTLGNATLDWSVSGCWQIVDSFECDNESFWFHKMRWISCPPELLVVEERQAVVGGGSSKKDWHVYSTSTVYRPVIPCYYTTLYEEENGAGTRSTAHTTHKRAGPHNHLRRAGNWKFN